MMLAVKEADDEPSYIDEHMHHAPSVPCGVVLEVPSIVYFDARIGRCKAKYGHQQVYNEKGLNSLSFSFHILCLLMINVQQR